MADAPFIPARPSCGYDLTGTPRDTCPECGKPFDRELVWSGWYQRDRGGGHRDWLILAAVIAGLVNSGTPTRFPHGHPWLYFGLIWALAAAWIALRWRDVVGPKPWLALWLILVALVAPGRAGMTEQHQHAAGWISGAIALVALAFAAARDWPTAVRGVLFGVSVLAWITAAVCGVGVALSQTGLSDDASYRIGMWEARAGGINDLIALLIGAAGGGVGWTAWRAGRWIAGPRHSPGRRAA